MIKKEFYAIPDCNENNFYSVGHRYISKDEFDKMGPEKFFYFLYYNADSRLVLFKKETNSFELITKIIFNYKGKEEIIEGPEILKKYSSKADLKELFDKKENIKIWTEKSGAYFIPSFEQIFFRNDIKFPQKLIIEETEKTLKIRQYKKEIFRPIFSSRDEIKVYNSVQAISFDFENKKYRNYPETKIVNFDFSLSRCAYINNYHDSTLLYTLPDNMLNEINNALVSFYSEKSGKKYENKDISDYGIRSFAIAPDNPFYFRYSDFFDCNLPKEKEEFEKEIANILDLNDNSFFKEILYKNVQILFLLSACKKAGIKEYEKLYDFFKKNINAYLPRKENDSFYKNVKKSFENMLKYRKEEDIIYALNNTQEFCMEIFKVINNAESEKLFDGQMFDRFAYNKFNEHACALLLVYERNKIKELTEKFVKNASSHKNFGKITAYVVDDKDSLENFKHLKEIICKYTPWFISDKEPKKIIVVKDDKENYAFAEIDKSFKRFHTLENLIKTKEYDEFLDELDVISGLKNLIKEEQAKIPSPEIKISFPEIEDPDNPFL